jgi:hypothetical protein
MLIFIKYVNFASSQCDSGINLRKNKFLDRYVSKMESLGQNRGGGGDKTGYSPDLVRSVDVIYYNFLVIYLSYIF